MKAIRNRLLFLAGILGILTPLQAAAAEQDTVTLRQEEARVAVSVSMTDAMEEHMTAVSLALKIQVDEGDGGSDDIQVSFDFDAGLEDTEHDIRYQDGLLQIYAASDQTLFPASGELPLGYVEVTPKDASDTLKIRISYQDGSFQAVNSSYGSKKPEVTRVSQAVDMQIGAGVVYGVSTQTLEEYLEQARLLSQDAYTKEQWARIQEAIAQAERLLQEAGAGQDAIDEAASILYQAMQNRLEEEPAGGEQTGGSNMDQGLYDQTTRYESNPSDAKKIDSAVVTAGEKTDLPVDFSQGLPAAVAGILPGIGAADGNLSSVTGNGAGLVSGGANREKISVISPQDGPAGLQVINGGAGAGSGALPGQTEGEESASADQATSQEILLDRVNGGVVSEKESFHPGLPVIFIGAGAIVIVIAVMTIFSIKKHKKRKKHQSNKKHSHPEKPAGGRKKSGHNRRK